MSDENTPDNRPDDPPESITRAPRPDLNQNDIDYAVSAWSAALGLVPHVGSILGEVVRNIVPNQRQDRIADFVIALDDELGTLQRDVLELKMRTQEFVDLFREAAYQAAATPSDERRRRLAALLKNSLTHEEVRYEEERKLLSLLGRINDSELIILGYYGTEMVGQQAAEYYERHEDIVNPPLFETGMSDEEMRDATMKQECRDNLHRLGLIAPRKSGSEGITTLGKLLLEYVDGPRSEWEDD
ncbi:hypothetical protein [Rubrobacter radiotolerans]|uniref:Uncharacterized protein n=1 Tax=Rubrobacter radiotolerans TaxID=42256 RepID=A0AB35T6X0_RUBRA|nr:hypothetical protein [Rubrobacter radiotolerans]MDX5895297.1 hypothetical protein [Rubrobacter radiotolerans]SMC02004.1 conserved hypothetical protein [Rubrobacter radiotolerans DSM 5868]